VRILHLIPTLTGAGAECQLLALCGSLRAAGHDVMVGYVHHGRGIWSAGVPSHQFFTRRPWSPLLVAEIVTLIRRWRADVVQTWLPRMDVAGAVAAALVGVPVVVTEPNSGPSYDGDLKSRLRVMVARRVGATIIANSIAGEHYWQREAPALPRFLVPNSVPQAAIDGSLPQPRPPHAFVGVYTGRLEPQKRVDVLLRACAIVMRERDLYLWIAGEGSERARLEALAQELGVAERVGFRGFVTDVYPYLRAADFAALLSDYEGEPNAVLEAMAAGLPLILSETESHEPFRSFATLVRHQDVAATADGIRDLMDDRGRTTARTAAAREFLAARTPEENARGHEAVYRSLITPRAGALRVAIDASNLRSGGPITHLTELLEHARPASYGIERVTVWAGSVTLARLPARPWLERVAVPQLDRGLLWRLAWQRFRRPALTRHYHVLFAPGATPSRGFRPYVSMSQNMQPFDGRERARYPLSVASMRLWMLRYSQARAFRASTSVIFLTEFARDWIGHATGGDVYARSTVVPHGVANAFRQRPRPARPLASHSTTDPFRFVYVSDFYLYKHQWNVAEAVCQLREEGLPVTLDLIGAPVEPLALRKLAAILRRHAQASAAVRVSGIVPHAQLPRIYREAHAFVFASTCENLPLTLLEAMASGLPIASASERPMTDILGDRAIYFDPEDPASVADALRALATDHVLRERSATANYDAAAAYSWQRCADETFALIARAARGDGATGDAALMRLSREPLPRPQARAGRRG
jgi:glycosyltransferase involved in cell wall biosynthesis